MNPKNESQKKNEMKQKNIYIYIKFSKGNVAHVINGGNVSYL
jgi:hypothetical protein